MSFMRVYASMRACSNLFKYIWVNTILLILSSGQPVIRMNYLQVRELGLWVWGGE